MDFTVNIFMTFKVKYAFFFIVMKMKCYNLSLM